MPYGLPGAMKLVDNIRVAEQVSGQMMYLKDGTVVQPLYPCADQDGYNGEWLVYVPKSGRFIVPREVLQ